MAFRASDDLDQPDKIRSLLKDLREVRQAKIREGLPVLDDKMLRVRTCMINILFILMMNVCLLHRCQVCALSKSMKSDHFLPEPWVCLFNSTWNKHSQKALSRLTDVIALYVYGYSMYVYAFV